MAVRYQQNQAKGRRSMIQCHYHRTGEKRPTEFFDVGFMRQATRSLCIACQQLGVSAVHSFGGCAECQEDAVQKVAEGRTDLTVYQSYRACFHVAAVHWRKLAADRPTARFILPQRPIEEWLNSCDYRCSVAQRTHKGQPWFELHWKGLVGQNVYDREVWKDKWQKHVEDVLATLGNRVLVIDVFTEADDVLWSKLAGFLGVNVPEHLKKFPKKIAIPKIAE